MPIYLPPATRRCFLQRSIATGAGLLLSPRLAAADDAGEEHLWAMLADPHIAADPAQLGRGINMTDHLRQVCREILALPTAPAGVIIHGDCAFSTGRVGDYGQLLKLLQPLRDAQLPIHLALGNHDNLQRFHSAVQPIAPSAVPEKYVSLVQSPQANFFILDSLNGSPASNPGLLGEAQLRWLAGALDQHPDKSAIVVAHHNPPKLTDWEPLLAVMDQHKQVKAMFHGHRHIWGLGKTPGGVHLINLLPVSYPSPKQTKPGASGWVLARFAPDRVRLEVRCLMSEHPLHGSAHDLTWRGT